MAKIRGPADKAAPATPPQSAAQLFQSGAFKEINITTSVSDPGETQVHDQDDLSHNFTHDNVAVADDSISRTMP
jgi:hypothetical protein